MIPWCSTFSASVPARKDAVGVTEGRVRETYGSHLRFRGCGMRDDPARRGTRDIPNSPACTLSPVGPNLRGSKRYFAWSCYRNKLVVEYCRHVVGESPRLQCRRGVDPTLCSLLRCSRCSWPHRGVGLPLTQSLVNCLCCNSSRHSWASLRRRSPLASIMRCCPSFYPQTRTSCRCPPPATSRAGSSPNLRSIDSDSTRAMPQPGAPPLSVPAPATDRPMLADTSRCACRRRGGRPWHFVIVLSSGGVCGRLGPLRACSCPGAQAAPVPRAQSSAGQFGTGARRREDHARSCEGRAASDGRYLLRNESRQASLTCGHASAPTERLRVRRKRRRAASPSRASSFCPCGGRFHSSSPLPPRRPRPAEDRASTSGTTGGREGAARGAR